TSTPSPAPRSAPNEATAHARPIRTWTHGTSEARRRELFTEPPFGRVDPASRSARPSRPSEIGPRRAPAPIATPNAGLGAVPKEASGNAVARNWSRSLEGGGGGAVSTDGGGEAMGVGGAGGGAIGSAVAGGGGVGAGGSGRGPARLCGSMAMLIA